MSRLARWCFVVALVSLWADLCIRSAAADDSALETLRGQIESLAQTNGFSVSGLYHLKGDAVPEGDRDLRGRIAQLLAPFNYAIISNAGGGIDKIVISGRKSATREVPQPDRVRTKSQAGHQLVDAILFGLNGQRRNARLMVDTGASAIVLPRSMIPALGYVEAELGEVTMQTANGLVKGRMAVLERVAVGRSVADDVAAAFVEDGALAGNMLLGMSFLGRFRMTIDKARNSITLEDK